MTKTITIALAGNPNCGKTTTFNALTGARQHVANYPGVTVERKEGYFFYNEYKIKAIDLPGTYSLSAFSEEELVSRNFLLDEAPDVIIDITDASNLERHLYLSVQLMELDIPVIITLNMMDIANARGIKIDTDQLSKLLGVPIFPTVASNNEGMSKVLQAVVDIKENRLIITPAKVNYGAEIEEEIAKIESLLLTYPVLTEKFPVRWLSVKLLENDKHITKKALLTPASKPLLDAVEESRKHLHSIFGEDAETVITYRRYGFIEGAYHESAQITPSDRIQISDTIDKVMTHRVFGLPIFFGLMWGVYQLTFIISRAPTKWIESGIKLMTSFLGKMMPETLFKSLLIDGVIGGVGNVIMLMPPIIMLFMAIAILEDSGYMSRIAFIMDKIMHKMGLHGKSVIPMILGFGCGVPAIMSTRMLHSKKDRLITMLIIPLMSCSARFPVYAMMIEAFFPGKNAGNVLFSIYIIGIVMAVIVARFFRRYLFPGESSPFVMELPPYLMPTAKGVAIHMWDRSSAYLKKAGTIILAFSVLIWLLGRFPVSQKVVDEYAAKQSSLQARYETERKQLQPGSNAYAQLLNKQEKELGNLAQEETDELNKHTAAGRIGSSLVPVLRPIGLGDWKIGIALFSGFVAKEVVVSTFGTLYQMGGSTTISLREAIRHDPVFNPLTAYVFMIFVLLYVPCVSTLAVLRKESGSWKWPLFLVAYTTGLAWVVSFLIYQGGLLLGLA